MGRRTKGKKAGVHKECREASESQPGQIEDILRRVDALPILEARADDKIVGYDENGIPAQPGTPGGRRVLNAVEDFLRYRHRDWEQ